MMSSENSGFTARDIERYHSGKMSAKERHALEKAALEDPFLADALEGYALTSTPAADLSIIQSRLDEKLNRKKVVPLFRRYRWLSAAAILLILAGAGWFTFRLSNNNDSSSIARQEQLQHTDDSVANRIVEAPVNPTFDSPAGRKQEPITDKENSSHQLTVQRQTRETKAAPAKDKQPVVSLQNASTESNLPRVNTDQRTPDKGYVTRMETKALDDNKTLSSKPVAENKAASALRAPSASDSGNNAHLIGRRQGLAKDTIQLDVVLQPRKMQVEEVVVNTGRTQKESAHRYPVVIVDSLNPEIEGEGSFDDYVAENIMLPDELKSRSLSGEVQLSFDVDRNGRPTNITILKSLCLKCDEEAIRLLRAGPNWEKKKNKKGKITLRF